MTVKTLNISRRLHTWNPFSPHCIITPTYYFYKQDVESVAFALTSAETLSIKANTFIETGDAMVCVTREDTAVVMPPLVAGTDYAIYACWDGKVHGVKTGSIRADASFTAPAGYTTANSRQIGGFHYAPGGNAPARAGGDATPSINPYSIWDLHWRPACLDPRGMALVANNFWCDIYLLGVDHHVNGTSKYNVAIADSASPPKIPDAFGGNGSSGYSSLTQFIATEVITSHGKQLPTYQEFAAYAYGSTENSSAGSDPVNTILRQAYTSKWGIMLATGNMLIWGRDLSYRLDGGDFNAAKVFAWQSELTNGRGDIYKQPLGVAAALFGGHWSGGANSGSRASIWNDAPWNANNTIGARGIAKHLWHGDYAGWPSTYNYYTCRGAEWRGVVVY